MNEFTHTDLFTKPAAKYHSMQVGRAPATGASSNPTEIFRRRVHRNLYPLQWWGQPENLNLYLYPFSELLRFAPLAFIAVIPWILVAVTLFDAVRHTAGEWDRSDQDQLLWTIVILSGGFIPVVGPVAYLLVARPRLRAVTRRTSMGHRPGEPSSVGPEHR